jgi:hypothetical protein
MRFSQILPGARGGWVRELTLTVAALLVGFLAMPALIYFVGSNALGRYEGASLGRLFRSVYGTLQSGSLASWAVLLGPYALFLMFRGLRVWWHAGTGQA